MVLPAFAKEPDDETDRFVGMSPEARLRIFFELCELTESIVAGRPNSEALRAPTPLSAESQMLWSRLMSTKGA